MIDIKTNSHIIDHVKATGSPELICTEITYIIGLIYAGMYAKDKDKAREFKETFENGMTNGITLGILFDERIAQRLVNSDTALDAELLDRIEVDAS